MSYLNQRESCRLKWIDIAKGIAILCVIIGHSCDGFVRILIYSFHMPLLFIISGYTIKESPIDGIVERELKDAKRLLIPCLWVRFAGVLYEIFYLRKDFISSIIQNINALLWGNHISYRYGCLTLQMVGFIWFLIALFWAKLLYRLICSTISSDNRIIIFLFGTFFSEILANYIIFPQGWDLVFVIMFYFEIGQLFKACDEKCVRIPVGLSLPLVGGVVSNNWLYWRAV